MLAKRLTSALNNTKSDDIAWNKLTNHFLSSFLFLFFYIFLYYQFFFFFTLLNLFTFFFLFLLFFGHFIFVLFSSSFLTSSSSSSSNDEVMLIARIFLTIPWHPSLPSIFPIRPSWLHSQLGWLGLYLCRGERPPCPPASVTDIALNHLIVRL